MEPEHGDQKEGAPRPGLPPPPHRPRRLRVSATKQLRLWLCGSPQPRPGHRGRTLLSLGHGLLGGTPAADGAADRESPSPASAAAIIAPKRKGQVSNGTLGNRVVCSRNTGS